jgi:hypothetical protein
MRLLQGFSFLPDPFIKPLWALGAQSPVKIQRQDFSI